MFAPSERKYLTTDLIKQPPSAEATLGILDVDVHTSFYEQSTLMISNCSSEATKVRALLRTICSESNCHQYPQCLSPPDQAELHPPPPFFGHRKTKILREVHLIPRTTNGGELISQVVDGRLCYTGASSLATGTSLTTDSLPHQSAAPPSEQPVASSSARLLMMDSSLHS